MGHHLKRRHIYGRQAHSAPATPAKPATPATPAKPATPATPAVPVPPPPTIPTPVASSAPIASSSVPTASVPGSAVASPSMPVIPSVATTTSSRPSKPSHSKSADRSIVANSTATGVSSSSSPNTGGIIGGVFGGIALLAVICFLVWFFMKRNRRKRSEGGEKIFSPAKFRRSAIVLDGSDHDQRAGALLMTQQGPQGTVTPYTDYPSSPVYSTSPQNSTQTAPPSGRTYTPSTAISAPPSTYGHGTSSFYNPHPALSTISSVSSGMPQDSQYSYEGQPIIPDHLGRSTPAGYTPAQRTPMRVFNTAEVDDLPPAYQDATRDEAPVQVREKSRFISLSPTTTTYPGGVGPSASPSASASYSQLAVTPAPSRQRPTSVHTTIYNPDDVYGGI